MSSPSSPSHKSSPSSPPHDDRLGPIEMVTASSSHFFNVIESPDRCDDENSSTHSTKGSEQARARGMTVDSRVDFDQLAADLNNANPYTNSESINYIMVKEIRSVGLNHDERVKDRKVTTRQLYNEHIEYTRKIDKDLKASSITQCEHAREVKIHELRKLEFELNPHEERSIFIRRHCVLLALDPIRAMITAEKLILFIAPGADGFIQVLEDYLLKWIPETYVSGHRVSISFEMHAYEAMLTTMKSLIQADYTEISKKVNTVSNTLVPGTILSVEDQQELFKLKLSMHKMALNLGKYRDTLSHLLENETDEVPRLFYLQLSELKKDSILYSNPTSKHGLSIISSRSMEEMDEKIESYLFSIHTIKELKLDSDLQTLRTREDYFLFSIEMNRNQLLVETTKMTVLSVMIGFGGYLAGIFGMNLDNSTTDEPGLLQQYRGSFVAVFVISFVIMLFGYFIVHNRLTRCGILPKVNNRGRHSSSKY